jgi:hypothetical protein
MIKHVVMWKLKRAADPAEARRTLEDLKRAVQDLKGEIDLIKDLEVGINLARVETAFDIVAILSFENWDDLLAYLAHPAHTKIGEVIGPIRDSSAVVDFEV